MTTYGTAVARRIALTTALHEFSAIVERWVERWEFPAASRRSNFRGGHMDPRRGGERIRAVASVRRFLLPAGTTPATILPIVMWPIAILTMLDAVVFRAFAGDATDDFRPVRLAVTAFLHHRPVYTENLDTTDPHYLYPPGGTLLLAPLGPIDEQVARQIFVVVNAAAIVAAICVLVRMFGYRLDTGIAPIALTFAFLSEATINTLTFGNVNGIILLLEAVFLRALLARRNIRAGLVMGLTITVKPTLAPLLLITIARRQWSTIVTAVITPVAITAIAWPLSTDPLAYFQRNLPYSMHIRDYFNSSISGMARYYGISPPLTLILRAGTAILIVSILWLLYRYYRRDEVFFVGTTAGVLMLGSFLLSSLGQQYYSMFAFPLLMTVTLRQSLIRNWPAWAAIFAFMSYDKWLLDSNQSLGRALEYWRVPIGWAALLIVMACVLTDRYLAATREGRLADGIDPPHLAPDLPGRAHTPSSHLDIARSFNVF
ncbi:MULTISPECIES: glycosyltransferase family 87 protein [unclassified Nocardia]|uniref:glycosyltransferase family 87 protein n=1 Tax=unclassified Nocardia TaxID=2637762 RepID=UPI0035DD3DDA